MFVVISKTKQLIWISIVYKYLSWLFINSLFVHQQYCLVIRRDVIMLNTNLFRRNTIIIIKVGSRLLTGTYSSATHNISKGEYHSLITGPTVLSSYFKNFTIMQYTAELTLTLSGLYRTKLNQQVTSLS